MVFLAVEGLAGIGGEPVCPVNIVRAVHVLRIFKAARVFPLKLLNMLFCQAPQTERVALAGGEFPQRLDGRAQRAGTDGKNKGGLALVAQLGEHTAAQAADKLAIMLVPDIDVAEIVVRAGAVLGHDDLIHPGLVPEGDGFELYHKKLPFQ